MGDVFKQVANQIISDLIRIAIQQAIIKPIAGALFGGAPIGGFAAGGSFMVGGRPGIDQNLLSLNGSPVARVGRGERVTVTPQGGSPSFAGGAIGGRGGGAVVQQTIHVDARGAVMNDQFARMILSQAKDYSNQAASTAYSRSLKDAPRALRNANRYGTS